MGLSTSTIITLGTILLVICVLSVCKRAFSTIMGVVGICILVIFIIQSTSDVVLIDFGNLFEVIADWAMRLFHWAEDTFWPSITDVAREIEQLA